MIVSEVKFKDRVIELCANDVDINNNVFTILVGRNGCGKSTLLQKICLLGITSLLHQNDRFHRLSNLFEHTERKENTTFDETGCLTLLNGSNVQKILIEKPICYPHNLDLSQFTEEQRQSIIDHYHNHNHNFGRDDNVITKTFNGIKQDTFDKSPKLIAVSSSPFDKYPMTDQRTISHTFGELNQFYQYRGARTKNSSSKSYMRAKFDQLGSSFINFFLKAENRTNEILPLFTYLGITTKFKVLLEFPFHNSFKDLSDERKKPLEAISSSRFFKQIADDKKYTEEDSEKITRAVKAIQEGFITESNRNSFEHHGKAFSLDLDINTIKDNKTTYLEEFSILAMYDLIDLVDIEFTKEKDDKNFFLTEASSGELCILFNVLAIAGTITDDSIILLDEPELSLHPEWQKDFLPLLEEVFSKYKKCHFIIATHSPNIVSSIPESNAFIVNMEDIAPQAIPSKSFHYRSADYQLARLFKAPGHSNTELINSAINIFSKVKRTKKFDDTDKVELKILNEIKPYIDDDDPVIELIDMLNEVAVTYG
ncbi:MAG: putative ATPase [Alteromonadaceae bacterium]|jgi:predicted ATPase